MHLSFLYNRVFCTNYVSLLGFLLTCYGCLFYICLYSYIFAKFWQLSESMSKKLTKYSFIKIGKCKLFAFLILPLLIINFCIAHFFTIFLIGFSPFEAIVDVGSQGYKYWRTWGLLEKRNIKSNRIQSEVSVQTEIKCSIKNLLQQQQQQYFIVLQWNLNPLALQVAVLIEAARIIGKRRRKYTQ